MHTSVRTVLCRGAAVPLRVLPAALLMMARPVLLAFRACVVSMMVVGGGADDGVAADTATMVGAGTTNTTTTIAATTDAAATCGPTPPGGPRRRHNRAHPTSRHVCAAMPGTPCGRQHTHSPNTQGRGGGGPHDPKHCGAAGLATTHAICVPREKLELVTDNNKERRRFENEQI